MSTKYTREKQMYPHVRAWLKFYLQSLNARADISTYDTSTVALSRFLESNDLQEFFPQYHSYDIYVDVTGIVQTGNVVSLAFVECKLNPIGLRDISQLLGYSKVASPIYSIITSPAGIGSAITYLLNTYGRLDVLEYAQGRRLKVATWDSDRREIKLPTLIPTGEFNLYS